MSRLPPVNSTNPNDLTSLSNAPVDVDDYEFEVLMKFIGDYDFTQNSSTDTKDTPAAANISASTSVLINNQTRTTQEFKIPHIESEPTDVKDAPIPTKQPQTEKLTKELTLEEKIAILKFKICNPYGQALPGQQQRTMPPSGKMPQSNFPPNATLTVTKVQTQKNNPELTVNSIESVRDVERKRNYLTKKIWDSKDTKDTKFSHIQPKDFFMEEMIFLCFKILLDECQAQVYSGKIASTQEISNGFTLSIEDFSDYHNIGDLNNAGIDFKKLTYQILKGQMVKYGSFIFLLHLFDIIDAGPESIKVFRDKNQSRSSLVLVKSQSRLHTRYKEPPKQNPTFEYAFNVDAQVLRDAPKATQGYNFLNQLGVCENGKPINLGCAEILSNSTDVGLNFFECLTKFLLLPHRILFYLGHFSAAFSKESQQEFYQVMCQKKARYLDAAIHTRRRMFNSPPIEMYFIEFFFRFGDQILQSLAKSLDLCAPKNQEKLLESCGYLSAPYLSVLYEMEQIRDEIIELFSLVVRHNQLSEPLDLNRLVELRKTALTSHSSQASARPSTAGSLGSQRSAHTDMDEEIADELRRQYDVGSSPENSQLGP